MTEKDSPSKQKPTDEQTFKEHAGIKPPNVVFEFVDFLRFNKKWWLTPVVLVLLVLSVFIALTNTAIGPFIYVLF